MSRRTLILLRHAKSDGKQPGLTDHDRPLNGRGRRNAPRMGTHIEQLAIPIDLILASTAVRVRQTLESMQAQWQRLDPPVRLVAELYMASPRQILELLGGVENPLRHVMVIGHNPGLEELAEQLSGTRVDFPTAGVAVFETTAATWARACQSTWKMVHYCRPRDLAPD